MGTGPPGVFARDEAGADRSATRPNRGLRFLDIDVPRPPTADGLVRPRRRFAVCIGIDGYSADSGYGPLQFAGADAIAVAESLVKSCGFEDVLLLTDAKRLLRPLDNLRGKGLRIVADPSRGTIRGRVEEFLAQATGIDDVVMFYFAGHGDVGRTAFLVPLDYHKKRAPFATVRVSEVFELLQSEPVYARNRFVVLDACRSSPADGEGRVMARGFRDSLIQPDQRVTVITACDASESSFESPDLGHGRFTWALVRALGGDAYPSGEENLLVTNIFNSIKKTFEREKWERQNPMFFSAGSVFAIAHRDVPRPQPFDKFEWEKLEKDRREAQRLYHGNQLEQASSEYRYCLRVLETQPAEDREVRGVRGRLLAERARASYRLGRRGEAEGQLKESVALVGDGPLAAEVRGYLAFDTARYEEAATQLKQAIEGHAEDPSSYLAFRYALALYRLEQFNQAAAHFLRATAVAERLGLKGDAAQYRRWAAQSLTAVGKADTAEILLRQALGSELHAQGSDPVEAAEVRTALAEALLALARYREARVEAEAALTAQRKAKPLRPAEIVRTLRLLARILERQGDLAGAEVRYREATETLDANPDGSDRERARLLNDRARLDITQGKYETAVAHLKELQKATELHLGRSSGEYAVTLNNLAFAYYNLGRYAVAVPLLEESLSVPGASDADKAEGLKNLALGLHAQGDHSGALRRLQQALELQTTVLGERHPDTAATAAVLAGFLRDQGDYPAALHLMEQAVAVIRSVSGDEHPEYANVATGLALLLRSMGDDASARPLLERALAIRRRTLGEQHPATAESLSNLAVLLRDHGQFNPSRTLLEQALKIRRKSLGPDHPADAADLDNLASLLAAQGELDQSRLLYEEALAIRKKVLGAGHPAIAPSLSGLARVDIAAGRYAEGRARLTESLAIRTRALGPDHPEIAQNHRDLANLLLATGDLVAAEAESRTALEFVERHLRLTLGALPERQQLRLANYWRPHLDLWLSILVQQAKKPADAYARVLEWKGVIFDTLSRRRLALGAPDAASLETYRGVTRELARLALDPSTADQVARTSRIRDLAERKQELERDLARRSSVFRQVETVRRTSLAEISRVLPTDVVLIDFVEYAHSSRARGGNAGTEQERRLLAFILRPDRDVVAVSLGPAGPVGDEVMRWCMELERRGSGRVHGAELRRRIWSPLIGQLGRPRTVLISPDGPLTRLPFAALPGVDASRYLIEELGLAITVDPRQLPVLLGGGAPPPDPQPSLLLVGDIDYGSVPTGPGAGKAVAFAPLRGTRAEIFAIGDAFSKRFPQRVLTVLRGSEASESRFRETAPRHRYLHVATHGYYRPPSLRSSPDLGRAAEQGGRVEPSDDANILGFNPRLLSGIVLAGANQRPQANSDDGILTALELADLDLPKTEMVVLSSGEGAAGSVEPGDGSLSLQREFLVAGARTVVASTLAVSDEAAVSLMTEFYRNLWQRGLGKLEALRMAQLTVLNRDGGDPAPKSAPRRTPPLNWAGFSLSGDWR